MNFNNNTFCKIIEDLLINETSFPDAVEAFINTNFHITYRPIPRIGLYFDDYDDAVQIMNNIKQNHLPHSMGENGRYGTSFLYLKNTKNERKYKIIFEYKNIYPDNLNNIAKIAICREEPLKGQEMLQEFGIINNDKRLSLLISTYLRMEECIFALYNNNNYVCLNNETPLKEMFQISTNF